MGDVIRCGSNCQYNNSAPPKMWKKQNVRKMTEVDILDPFDRYIVARRYLKEHKQSDAQKKDKGYTTGTLVIEVER